MKKIHLLWIIPFSAYTLLKVVTLIAFCIMLILTLSQAQVEENFRRDQAMLNTIANELNTLNYPEFRIEKNGKTIEFYAAENANQKLGKKELADPLRKKIEDLFDQKYRLIWKTENTIFFQRWSNQDSGKGILYCPEGNLPKNHELVKAEALTDDGWYYYELNVKPLQPVSSY